MENSQTWPQGRSLFSMSAWPVIHLNKLAHLVTFKPQWSTKCYVDGFVYIKSIIVFKWNVVYLQSKMCKNNIDNGTIVAFHIWSQETIKIIGLIPREPMKQFFFLLWMQVTLDNTISQIRKCNNKCKKSWLLQLVWNGTNEASLLHQKHWSVSVSEFVAPSVKNSTDQ